jgi:hypothetical protein
LSDHARDELERRRRALEAVARGEEPSPLRPAAERDEDGALFAHCGAKDGAFSDWTCADGLECRTGADPEIGSCLPPGPPPVGAPCETGLVTANRDPHRDAAHLARAVPCADYRVCEKNSVGFPGGLCAGGCDGLDPPGVCGRIAILDAFNRCVAAHEPFTDCVTRHSRPGALRACGANEPCRDDYVCARLPGGGGACIPPYFLFQLRVDGHAL